MLKGRTLLQQLRGQQKTPQLLTFLLQKWIDRNLLMSAFCQMRRPLLACTDASI